MWFKGYIRTKNKKALERFKNVRKLNSYDDVKNLPEYAGVLSTNTVLIDVDNKKESDLLLDIIEKEDIACQVRETTRGKHFYFLNNGDECFKKCHTGVKLACGVTADIKVGTSASYSILKFANVERPVVFDKHADATYDTVPCWLTVVNSSVDLLNLGVGDGRNSALFGYILNLQRAKLNKNEIRKTLQVINDNVFKKPLSEQELETIARDDAFKEDLAPTFFDGKNFLFNEFATHLKSTLPIKKIGDVLHVYSDGYYKDGMSRIESEMIKVIPTLNKAKRVEVYEYIKLLCEHEENAAADAKYIAFNNGIYDLEKDKLMPFSPDILITNKIPFDYNPYASSVLLDDTLNKISCGDASIRTSLEEMAGYCLYRRNELRKAFILVGDRANGKSTYLSLIQTMLGDENVSTLDLREISVEKFKRAELYRKLANIGDDISEDFISDASTFKKVVSGDPISAERKGEHPFSFKNYSKLIFSANNLPRIKDKTGAVLSRLIIVPFNATFDKNDPNYKPFIKYELQKKESIEYLIKLGVDALKNILAKKEFTVGDKIIEQLDEYDTLNNPLLGFFEDGWDRERILRESIEDSFNAYKEYCLVNGLTSMSRIEYSRQTNKIYNLKISRRNINGQAIKFFIEN